MVKNYNFLILTIGLFICGLSPSYGQIKSIATDGVFYIKGSDGHETQEVDGQLTFKAVASGTIPTSRDAGVTFYPKNAGDIIQITVEDIDLNGSSSYLLLYQGEVTTKYPMPDGWFAKIGKDEKNNTYLSESPDGKFTIGFHSPYSVGTQTGWNITVKAITPADMTYRSASAFLENTDVNRGGQNQILLGINIKTDGQANPINLTGLKLANSLSAGDIKAYKIYATGSSKVFATDNKLDEGASISSSINVSTNVALKNGNNYFWFVVDLEPNVLSGKELSVNLVSVDIDSSTKLADISSPTNAAVVSSNILMTADHTTFTINSPVNFYDDGGKDGKISKNFNGSITFVPATSGNKIKVDFSKFEIFNTSTVGYNDIFKFYNGQIVDETNLLTTLLAEPEIVKSTATDGSLTITLASTTGVPANGWEAIVSEYTPGPMALSSVVTSVPETSNIAAGDEECKMLVFNIKADNNVNPLYLQSLSVDASKTSVMSNLASAKVYYLGKKENYDAATLFGSITSLDSETFQIIGSQELLEGNNYFAIVYNIDNKSLNDELFGAKLTNINLSGTLHSISDSEVAERKVENIFKAIKGNFVRSIYGDWVYTDTKSPYTDLYYNYVDEDCVVTFKPTTAGAVAEIDFSSFDVYYADSSYGTKGVFDIYAGGAVDDSKILWKLDSNAKSKVGPIKKIRSTAADGSITIKFNAKTTSQYYAGKGWVAKVKEFVNHNMSVDSISVTQTNAALIKPCATNQEIIGFEVITDGTLSLADLTAVKLNLKNSAQWISKATVLYSGEENDFSAGVEFGSISTSSTDEVTITGSQTLVEGKNYFWVSYDTKDDIDSGKEIDASLLSITVDNAIYTPANGDPDGNRLTTNTIELANGDNGTIRLTKTMSFYDDGGVDNNYSKSFDGKIVFIPANTNEVVKLKFNDFRTYMSDYIYIYSGTVEDDSKLILKTSGSNIPVDILGLPEDGGALTIRFKSVSSGSTFLGWDAEVSSYVLQPNTVQDISVEEVGDSDIIRGAIKSPMLKVIVKVVGDKDEVTLNDFKFNIGETTNYNEIKKARLYYTSTSNSFLTEIQFGEDVDVSSLNFSTTDGLEINKAGTYYLWLTYDINEVANVGNKVGASITKVQVDGTDYIPTSSIAAQKTIKSGFKGTYTIGASSSANYSTFAQAIAAMDAGLEGAVVFNIESGTYNEDIKISKIKGVSEKNTITLTSLSGKNNDVVIKGKGYNTPPYGESAYGMCKVDSTSYVTIENISFIPTDQSYPYAVHVYNSSRYFTLRNCIVNANLITSGYSGMNLVYLKGKDEEGSNNDYATLDGNTLTGGYIAFYLGGTGYVALTKEKGLVVRNNRVINACSKGIYLTDEKDAIVEGNNVSSESTLKTDYQAIDIYRNKGNLVIRNNIIVNKQGVYSKGINLRSEVAGTTESPALVYNNSIAIINSPSSSTAAITLSGDCSYINFLNNSVRVGGSGGYIFSITGTYVTISNINIINNLFQNYTPSSIYYFVKQQQYEALALGNNVYYLAGGQFAGSSWASDLAAWATLTNEQNATLEQADFFTDTDLHLKAAGNLNLGLVSTVVTSDLDGNARSATPTVGAYEYVAFDIETPVMESGYPKLESSEYNKATFAVKMNQPGKLYYIIKPVGDTAPTVTELQAAESTDMNLNEEVFILFENLTELTEYTAYFYQESIFGLNSVVIPSSTFKTPVQVFPMVVTLPANWGRIEANETVNMYPIVTGGVYPYQYTWYNSMNEVISTDSILSVSPEHLSHYSLNIKDSNIEDQTSRTAIFVNSTSKIATFDDNYLADESYWQGYNDLNQSVFYSGTYSFENIYYPDQMTWAGFGYANITDSIFNSAQMLTDQFKSVTGGGVSGSKNYGISYTLGSSNEIVVMNDDSGETIPGVYLTNAAYTMHSIKNGDSFIGNAFEQGDWYKVTITGTHGDNSTSSIDCYLADYRDADASKHYALDTWKWFDLSSLGNVTKLNVTVDGSRTNGVGLTIPAYYCIDNLGSEDPEKPLFDMTINGEAWDVRDIYALDCAMNLASVQIKPKAGYNCYMDGVLLSSTSFTKILTKPGLEKINLTLKSTIGDDEKDYTLVLEKYFAFDDIVAQMWNNTLVAITNSENNGGYSFASFRWFKNGTVVSNKHFYSAGNKKTDMLDNTALYLLELTTTDGDVLHTCESQITLVSANVILTPNPVSANTSMTLIADVDNSLLENASADIYNLQGIKISTTNISQKRTPILAPAISGTYILRFNSGSFHKEQKFIVK